MKIALFDFDGTLTSKDSFIEFIKFYRGKKTFLFGFALLSPIMFLYKLHIIKNWKAKEIVLKYFFRGCDAQKFQEKCNDFALKRINELLRPSSLIRINELKNEMCRTIIITASAENWIKAWSDSMGIEIIGTRLEVIDGKITGKIKGKNCYGKEKVTRLIDAVDLSKYSIIEVYGDSEGDSDLLNIATHKYYRAFE